MKRLEQGTFRRVRDEDGRDHVEIDPDPKKRRKHPGRTTLSSDLERVIHEVPVPKAERCCVHCEHEMTPMGYVMHERLEYVPPSWSSTKSDERSSAAPRAAVLADPCYVGLDDTGIDVLDKTRDNGKYRGHLWCFRGTLPPPASFVYSLREPTWSVPGQIFRRVIDPM